MRVHIEYLKVRELAARLQNIKRPEGDVAVLEEFKKAWPDLVGTARAAEMESDLGRVRTAFEKLDKIAAELEEAAAAAENIQKGLVAPSPEDGPVAPLVLDVEKTSGAAASQESGEARQPEGPSIEVVPGFVLVGRIATGHIATMLREYRDAGTTRDRRCKIAEDLGEQAGVEVLKDHTGRDVTMKHVSAPGAVPPSSNGWKLGKEPWDHALTWHGAGVVNLMYWDGKTLIVVECKGGSSRLGWRWSAKSDNEGKRARVQQGTDEYLGTIAQSMTESPLDDGRNEAGRALRGQMRRSNVTYLEARFGSYQLLRRRLGEFGYSAVITSRSFFSASASTNSSTLTSNPSEGKP